MKKILTQKYFYGGIAESKKVGIEGSFFFGEKMNIFDEPTEFSILPETSKVSGSTVTDLVKWVVSGAPYDTNKYFYGSGGNIYKETSAGVWSKLQTTANAGGQGLEIHDDYLYYTQDTQIGRYGTLSGTPSFTDDWQTGLNSTATTDIAPIKAFKEGLAVGHGNYLGWWDGATWDADRLVLPPGLNIRSLEVLNEYLVIGTWRGTSITDNEEGYLFFWDGTSTTFNYFMPMAEGGCNAMVNTQNRLFSVWGSSGGLYMNYEPFTKVQQIPKMTNDTYMEVLSGAMTNWKNITYIGVSGNTDNTSLKQGVYSFGSKGIRYPEVLNYCFPISTGTTTGTSLKIGAVKGMGNNLYIGWRDDTSYGVDKVTNSGDPYSSAYMETLIFDDNNTSGDKKITGILATHLPLASGESVQLSYKRDRASSYTDGDANDTENDTETYLPIPPQSRRFKEWQVKCTIATTGTTTPTITSLGFKYDDLKEEKSYGN